MDVVGEPRHGRRIGELEQAVGDEDGRLEQLDAREVRERPLRRRQRADAPVEQRAELPLLDRELVLVMAVFAVERPRAHGGDEEMAKRPALRLFSPPLKKPRTARLFFVSLASAAQGEGIPRRRTVAGCCTASRNATPAPSE